MHRARAVLPPLLAAALAAGATGCLLDSGVYDAGGNWTGPGTGASATSGSDTGTAASAGTGGTGGKTMEGACGCDGCMVGTLCAGCGPDGQGTLYQRSDSSHCYLLIKTAAQRDDARATCAKWNTADLMAPSTANEMDELLASTLVTQCIGGDLENGRCWTGGDDQAREGQFIWLNGEPWLAEKDGGPAWSIGEPNGDTDSNCVVLGGDGTIRDRDCTAPYPYICEREP